jgi:hypothetical protein
MTSSGGNNTILTCIVSGNIQNGIEIGGNAQGIQVEQTATGTNTGLQYADPNGGDGVKIDGSAQGIFLGGFHFSVEPQNTFSGNVGYGVDVAGKAKNILVFNSNIGVNGLGQSLIPNELGGVYVGPGTANVTIGAPLSQYTNQIRGNGGNGVTLAGTTNATVLDDTIASNEGDGVAVYSSPQTTIGPLNTIAANARFGVEAVGNSPRSLIAYNAIFGNTAGDVDLSKSRGIVYLP